MAKSNMRSVRRRQTNRRIQTARYDKRRQDKARAYESRSHKRARATKSIGVIGRVGVYWRRAAAYMARFFTWGGASIDLDLRDGGVLGWSERRDAGAVFLRATFSQRLKMRSTRDGRKV